MYEVKVKEVYKTQGKYTLLKLANADYQPYVVAYEYDENSQTWGQGHYFQKYEEARLFFHSKVV